MQGACRGEEDDRLGCLESMGDSVFVDAARGVG